MLLKFAEFSHDYFLEYQHWFEGDAPCHFPDENLFNYLKNDADAKAIAVLDENDEFVAEIQIDRDPDGDAYIAIAVKPEKRGQGIATYSFEKLLQGNELEGVKRLVAYVEAGDEASSKMLDKVGFRFDGVVDENGCHEYVYELLAAYS